MGFSDDIVQSVWEKARAIPDRDPAEWRQDECGAWIRRDHYGSPDSGFGWKIEHISPDSSDDLDHLRPFHRDNAFSRGVGKAHCRVTADREGVAPTAHIDSPRNKTVR
jgi:hypothetical protein